MEEITRDLNEDGEGSFFISSDGKQLGKMVFSQHHGRLVVQHTEVSPEVEGKGYAKKLLEEMVAYARSNSLQVVPLCAYVAGQFKRHPELYTDLV